MSEGRARRASPRRSGAPCIRTAHERPGGLRSTGPARVERARILAEELDATGQRVAGLDVDDVEQHRRLLGPELLDGRAHESTREESPGPSSSRRRAGLRPVATTPRRGGCAWSRRSWVLASLGVPAPGLPAPLAVSGMISPMKLASLKISSISALA